MPIIKSAIKKVKQDKKRAALNRTLSRKLKDALKKTKKGAFNISEVYSVIDHAAKKGVIHKNKAGRLKSQVSKRVKNETAEKPKTTKRRVVKKTSKVASVIARP